MSYLRWARGVMLIALGVVPCPARGDFPLTGDPSYYGFNETRPELAFNANRNLYLVGYSALAVLSPDPDLRPAYFIRAVRPTGAGFSTMSLGVEEALAPLNHYKNVFPFRHQARGPLVYNPLRDEFLTFAVPEASWEPMGVYGRFLDGSGVFTSLQFLVLEGQFHAGDPVTPGRWDGIRGLQARFNPLANEYLVTMQMKSGLKAIVWGVRLSATGDLLGPPINLTGSAAAIRSHSLAYAPIVSPETPAGRYLLAVSHDDGLIDLMLLDSVGVPLSVLQEPTGTPLDFRLPLPFGTVPGAAYHPDIAFGEMEGQSVFLVIWGDYNNTQPLGDPNLPAGEWTGVWGRYVSASRISYPSEPSTADEAFAISDLTAHRDAPAGEDWWMPRAVYSEDAASFFVAWRETPEDVSLNDPRQEHIRGARLESLSPPFPPAPCLSLSVATGPWPGDQAPLSPALAAGPDGTVLVAWEDNRNAPLGNERDPYGQLWGLPPHDAWPGAVEPAGGTAASTLAGASTDGGSACGGETAPDVWYIFTAPVDGTLRADTCGTHDMARQDAGIDTVLSLHDSGPGTPDNEIVCNDNWSGGDFPAACLESDQGLAGDAALGTHLIAGHSVLIRVSRAEASPDGPFMLNVAFQPDHDFCSAAITTGPGVILGTTEGATQDGESSCGNPGWADTWYRFVAPASGILRASTCGTHDGFSGLDGGVDTILSLHDACPGSMSNEMVCNDLWTLSETSPAACAPLDIGTPQDAAMAQPVSEGQVIWIRVVRGATSPDGPFVLALDLDPCTEPRDGDGDGIGDTCDPCPDDVEAWAVPGEVSVLRFTDSWTLSWNEPDAPGATPSALSYEMLRATSPDAFQNGGVCWASSGGDTCFMTDLEAPDLDSVFFYLIRSMLPCSGSLGPLGTDSSGGPRSAPACSW